MDQSEIRKFAKAWIEFQATQQFDDAPEDDPAYETIFRLTRMAGGSDRKIATAICVEIANQSGDPWIMKILGASPLEDLLESFGHDVLPDFLAAAKENPNFRQALHHIWPREDKTVWGRFLSVRDNLILPGLPE
jgi:hypothetical protein